MNGDLYLDLMKRVLTDLVYEDPGVAPWPPPEFSRELRLGYATVDDDRAVPGGRQAVDDFRARHGIGEPIESIDWAGVDWRRDG